MKRKTLERRRFLRRSLPVLLLMALALGLAACGNREAPPEESTGQISLVAPAAESEAAEADPGITEIPEAAPEVTEEPPAPESTREPDTPAARAAALGLPEPPDVDITSWEFLLANSHNSIGEYEIPGYGGIEGQGIDPRLSEIAATFLHDARAAGNKAYLAAAYRNPEFLYYHYLSMLNRFDGDAYALSQVWCGVGVNEHQTGLALDFTEKLEYSAYYDVPFSNEGFEGSALDQWLREHCAEYGFIDRYPEGKEYYYGTACTEGHFRYVGEEAARYIMDNGICFEEFLMLYDPDRVFIPGAD